MFNLCVSIYAYIPMDAYKYIYIHMHEDMYIHTPDMYVILYVQTRCAPSAAPPATCAGDLMDLQAFCAAQEQKMKTVRRSLEMLGL